jgi:type I restriction enzyme M protein
MTRKSKTDAPVTTAQRLGTLLKSARDTMRKDKGLNGDLDRLPLLTWLMFLKFLDDQEQVREQRAVLKREKFRPTIAAPYRWRDWAAKEDGLTGDDLRKFITNDEVKLAGEADERPGLLAYLRRSAAAPTRGSGWSGTCSPASSAGWNPATCSATSSTR